MLLKCSHQLSQMFFFFGFYHNKNIQKNIQKIKKTYKTHINSSIQKTYNLQAATWQIFLENSFWPHNRSQVPGPRALRVRKLAVDGAKALSPGGCCDVRQRGNPMEWWWWYHVLQQNYAGKYASHMIHVWNMYLHLGDFRANVDKYTVHGAYGYVLSKLFKGRWFTTV